jgi:hypothetical protein
LQRAQAGLRLAIESSPPGTSDYLQHEVIDDTGTYTHRSNRVTIPASTDTQIVGGVLGDGNKVRLAGTAMLKTGSVVVQVDYNGVADDPSAGGDGNCYLYGTATVGTQGLAGQHPLVHTLGASRP